MFGKGRKGGGKAKASAQAAAPKLADETGVPSSENSPSDPSPSSPLMSGPDPPMAREGGDQQSEMKTKQVDIRQGVAGAIVIHLAFSVGFAVSSFMLSFTPDAGFNAVLFTIVLMAYNSVLIFGLHIRFGALMYGGLLGATMALAFISLQSAIFWGQMSGRCQGAQDDYWGINYNSCVNPDAMKAACAFGSLLFITEVMLATVLCAWVEVLCPEYSRQDGFLGIKAGLGPDGRGAYESAKGDKDGEVTVILPIAPLPQYQAAS